MSSPLQVDWRAEMKVPELSHAMARCALERVWFLFGESKETRIEVVILGEEEHTRLHQQHSKDPSSTDVLAFPFEDPDLLGEILINGDCAIRESAARHIPAAEEALLYIVHGALHLLGFRDDTPSSCRKMREAEKIVLHKEV